MIPRSHPLYVDLDGIDTGDPTRPLRTALGELTALYAALDARLEATTQSLALPCSERDGALVQLGGRPARGGGHPCSMCCHESVFMTPLEWFAVVDYMQTHFGPDELAERVQEGLRLYTEHRALIDAFNAPPPDGAASHTALARQLRYACPLLSDAGCRVYPARELLGRVFGQSFNDDGGVYGCELSGQHLGGKTLTLVRATAWAKRLNALPLTGFRQVYPYYFALTYAG